MNHEKLEKLIKNTLFDVAPELEDEEIDPDISFAVQFEIDSMDFLNFVIGLNKATGIEIPEADYNELNTLNGCISYLKTHSN